MELKNLKLLVLIFVVFLVGSTFQVDSFEVSEEENETSFNNINYLLSKTDSLRTNNAEQFSKNLEKLTKLKTSFDNSQLCYYGYLVAFKQGFEGQYKDAKSLLLSLLDECAGDIDNLVRINATLSTVYVISNEYDHAIDSLDYTIEHINDVHTAELKQIVYSLAMLVYRMVNQYDLSLKFTQLLINDNPSDVLLCKALSNKYRIKLKKSEVDSSAIEDTILQCEKSGEIVYSNLMRLDWIDFQLNKSSFSNQKLKSILAEVHSYEEVIINTNYTNLISIKDGLLAKIYWKMHRFDEFLHYAKMTVETSKTLGNTKQKIEILGLLVKYYQQVNDYERAFLHQKEKSEAEMLHFNTEQAKTMAFQTVKHNNLAKTHQIEYLNNQNKLLSLEKALTEKKSTNQKLIILFLFSLIGFMVLWGFRSRRVQNMYKHLSETDNMTGIYNRKGFKDFSEKLLLQSKKEGRPVAMAIFDLDRFKRINDKYGHLKGDWVIKKTITQCQLVQNDKITIGRIGGEEFAIVMRDSTSDELSEFVEECRLMIENIDSSATGHDFVITASFGVTSTNASGYVYSKLLSDADHAMYDAKTSGRNMVINYKYNPI